MTAPAGHPAEHGQAAEHWEPIEGGAVRCALCPHECRVAPGKAGLCRARVNLEGRLIAATYGRVSITCMDPIEKKPLYHFMPGRAILSLGSLGCNFRCRFCQNWNISQDGADAAGGLAAVERLERLSPEEAVALAGRRGSCGIAYTYNEPLIWFEYVRDAARLARAKGLANVLVTNGFANEAPLAELLEVADAFNIDVKGDDAFYQRLCGGRLEPMRRTAEAAAKRGAHVEVTHLVIPGENDGAGAFEEIAKWVAGSLGPATPAHLSAYFPRYELGAPPTPPETLLEAREVFSKHLSFVYLGNVMLAEGSDTVCPKCGALCVKRRGYETSTLGLTEGGRCAACGAGLNMRMAPGR